MPTKTYKALANITLGGTAATVTFGSIPATYRDLVIVTNTDNTVQANYHMRLNGDTGNNYSTVRAQGNGTVTLSNSTSNASLIRLNGSGDLKDDFSNNAIINIMDYSATDKHKTTLSRNNTASSGTDMVAGRYASTSAITSVELFPSTGSFEANSTFALYGIES